MCIYEYSFCRYESVRLCDIFVLVRFHENSKNHTCLLLPNLPDHIVVCFGEMWFLYDWLIMVVLSLGMKVGQDGKC